MATTHDPRQHRSDPEHHLEWNDRLQDWLDGDLADAEAPVFTAHLADCTLCQQRLADFEQLENVLQAPRLSLDAAFDARLFAQIDAIDETQRAAARQKVEQELQQNLRALTRNWRRTLAFIVPGIIGGMALAFALMGYFDASGLTGKVVAEGASELGSQSANLVHAVFIAITGASIGGVMAGWLAKAAD
jgi:anti-sigma factor RsiW